MSSTDPPPGAGDHWVAPSQPGEPGPESPEPDQPGAVSGSGPVPPSGQQPPAPPSPPPGAPGVQAPGAQPPGTGDYGHHVPEAAGHPRPGRSGPAASSGQSGTAGRNRGPLLLVAAVSAVVAALVATAITAVVVGDSSDDDDGVDPGGPAAVGASAEASDIRAILDQVQESVVTLETTVEGFGGMDGAGTGVILSEDGLVLTNAHVIGSLNEIQVRLFDGSEHDASLVGSQPDEDLAVIRIDGAEDLTPATLGSSEDLRVGDQVVAIGNALNLGGEPTVTTGIVSAQDRSISGPDPFGNRMVHLENLIQTDAAINPGNSGGPLLNEDGEVVGINTAIIQDSNNIGFAIAIDPVRSLIDDLRSGGGEVTPDMAFLGVMTESVETVDQVIREEFEITVDEGAMIREVTEGAAAEAAGLEPGDVIVEADGETMAESTDLVEFVRNHEPGDEVEFTIERLGDEQTVTAVLGERGG